MRLQLGEMWSGPKSEDTEYVRVKAMLKSLGLPVSDAASCLRPGMLEGLTSCARGLAASLTRPLPALLR